MSTPQSADTKSILDRLDVLEREHAEMKKRIEQLRTSSSASPGSPVIEPGTPGASPHAREVTGEVK